MSKNESENYSDNENICVVCFKNVEFYSVGVCDHPVCFECSTRMRVLCRQNECPICRQDMPKVLFTKKIEPFSFLYPSFERSNLQDRRFGILFCTSDIQKSYYKILEHRCQLCETTDRKWPFKTFQQLKDHMRREHELFYCDICTENLKIFSFERRCYTRQELGHHRRKGDPDNTSHRGHPLCEFCDTRYMDNDELFRHLRRNHHFCHFCDADGKYQYYSNMDDLRMHFREEHYLCEEGECKTMPMAAVFRTDIDLKAHITTEHGKYLSKSATKQARMLELEFTLAPRGRTDNIRGKSQRNRMDEDISQFNMEHGGPDGGEGSHRIFVNPLTQQDFPALGSASGSVTLQARPAVNFVSKMNSNFTGADFPSLGGTSSTRSSAVTITTNSSSPRPNRAPDVTITRTIRGPQGLGKDNFPALGGSINPSGSGSSTVRLSVNSNSSNSKTPKVSIQVNHRPNGAVTTHITTTTSAASQQRPTEAFPPLGGGTTVAQPQWVQVKAKKHEPKTTKAAQAPQLPPSDLAQFPSLAKKKSSVTVPVSSNWVNLNSINSSSKKNNTSGSGDSNNNKKNEPKPSNSKQKELVSIESKLNDIKLVDVESKNKKKKKKVEKNEADVDKQPKSKAASCKVNVTQSKSDNEANSKSKLEPSARSTESQNGLVKKRSELKIGTLLNTGENFPALGEMAPPPPPGFHLKPPPGFSKSFPAVGSLNDLTFTTSSGQSYAILPVNNYYQPKNFQARNQNLIKNFMSVLKNNEVIREFKTYSDLFRSGGLSADKYYEHCKLVLGGSFEEVFPELLGLLPDIKKQQELYSVYDGKNKKNLVVCENCRQVILKRELGEHYNYHTLDNHFPSLGNVQSSNNAWKK